MAGSLLLLRAANADEEAEDLLEDLMSGGLLEGQEENEQSTGARGNESTGSNIAESSIVSMSPGGTLSTISWQPSLESGNGPHAATRSSASKTSQILHAAFGNNVLARRDFRVDLFTAFTELCVIVKLLAVRGNDWFSAAGMLLVLGWLACADFTHCSPRTRDG
jgi:hypothetical protein